MRIIQLYNLQKNSTGKIAKMTDLISSNTKSIFDVGANCGLFSIFAEAQCPQAVIICLLYKFNKPFSIEAIQVVKHVFL